MCLLIAHLPTPEPHMHLGVSNETSEPEGSFTCASLEEASFPVRSPQRIAAWPAELWSKMWWHGMFSGSIEKLPQVNNLVWCYNFTTRGSGPAAVSARGTQRLTEFLDYTSMHWGTNIQGPVQSLHQTMILELRDQARPKFGCTCFFPHLLPCALHTNVKSIWVFWQTMVCCEAKPKQITVCAKPTKQSEFLWLPNLFWSAKP